MKEDDVLCAVRQITENYPDNEFSYDVSKVSVSGETVTDGGLKLAFSYDFGGDKDVLIVDFGLDCGKRQEVKEDKLMCLAEEYNSVAKYSEFHGVVDGAVLGGADVISSFDGMKPKLKQILDELLLNEKIKDIFQRVGRAVTAD